MSLNQYLCTNCDTLNHIHWDIVFSKGWEYTAPHCCECGESDIKNYKFIKQLEVTE
jgi:hypothetical protein